MKLDRIKFALLVSYIADMANRALSHNEAINIDSLTEINVDVEKVDELLKHINCESGLIEAIKAYRVLTNAGLKESKEAIERYRNVICTKVAS